MKMNIRLVAATAIAAVAVGFTVAGTPAQADSNTLHKIGNAIQYPIRKAGENISTDVHRANNKKSVEADRPHDARFVVRPGGTKVYKGPNGPVHHHRHHRHHHYITPAK